MKKAKKRETHLLSENENQKKANFFIMFEKLGDRIRAEALRERCVVTFRVL